MARKSRNPNFDQMLDDLRAHGFEIMSFAAVPNGMQATKNSVAAVLVPGVTDVRWDSGGARLAVTPGIVIRGEIARLVDRGYQKFIKIPQLEFPATASQLHAIHEFTEELNLVTGALGLYNEALGTTSDLYLYDRLRGREGKGDASASVRELADGH